MKTKFQRLLESKLGTKNGFRIYALYSLLLVTVPICLVTNSVIIRVILILSYSLIPYIGLPLNIVISIWGFVKAIQNPTALLSILMFIVIILNVFPVIEMIIGNKKRK